MIWYDTRDVNFGFFPKSIIVLKKINFVSDYQIWASLCRHLLCNVPRTVRAVGECGSVTVPWWMDGSGEGEPGEADLRGIKWCTQRTKN